MTSKHLGDLFDELGVRRSHSRPRCSNDNPHQESLFKTTKYAPGYPPRFETIAAAREYFEAFFTGYNAHHRHSSLGFLTPKTVFEGDAFRVVALKQGALDAAFAAHPGRFPKGRPLASTHPTTVSINPDHGITMSTAA